MIVHFFQLISTQNPDEPFYFHAVASEYLTTVSFFYIKGKKSIKPKKEKIVAKKIVVIGGAAAGPKIASKARRMDQAADITILEQGRYFSMASCGYPYYVGGVFDEKNQLICTPTGVLRDSTFFANAKGIKAHVKRQVTDIDRKKKRVKVLNLETNEPEEYPYDKLAIATGAVPIFPRLPGKELKGITTLHSMHDAVTLKHIAKEKKVDNAVIVGGGLIGIETCEALELAGINVTVVEMLPQILPFLDWELAKLVEKEIRLRGVEIITNNRAAEFIGQDGHVTGVVLQDGRVLNTQLVVVSIGVRPNAELAKKAGLRIGMTGGIWVNKFMQTSDPDIYAAGDCVEIRDLITFNKIKTHWPMGDAANLQARVVGQNITAGNCASYEGAVLTGICKVFDYCVGSAGLSETRARCEGYSDIITATQFSPDKPGFMGGKPIGIKMVADKRTGRLLGVQVVGKGDVSKRLALAALALHNQMHISELVNLDLPYAPPFSPAIDNFITAAHVLENKWLGRMKGISPVAVMDKVKLGADVFILDVRGPAEFEQMRLGIGEKLIPLGKLRSSTDKLPADKQKEIVVYCKISLRCYEAYSFLTSLGYENVYVMEGGILAWPFKREK